MLNAFGQKTTRTDYYSRDISKPQKPFLEKKLRKGDTTVLKQDIASVLSAWQWAGYLQAHVDTVVRDTSVNKIYLSKGPRYKWQHISANDTTMRWLRRAGYGVSRFDDAPLEAQDLFKLNQTVIQALQDNGYPFATSGIDSLVFKDKYMATGHLIVHPGPLITIDSVQIPTILKLSRSYLEAYIRVHPGDVYDESLLAAVGARLKELPFVEVVKPPAILFYGHRAKLILSLKNRNASSADVLLALGRSNNAVQNLTITGEGHMRLVNTLQHGESMNIDFNHIDALTTDFTAGGSYSYIYGKPYGIVANIDLFKQDSSYLNVTQQYGIQYFLQARQYIKMYVKTFASDILSIDTQAVIASHTLPGDLDVRSTSYGMQLYINNTDYNLNPTHGWEISADATVGQRHIKANPRITTLHDGSDSSFSFSSLYTGLTNTTTFYTVSGYVRHYMSFKRLHVIKLALSGAANTSPNILTNELYRLGGISTLRGFTEGNFYTPAYALTTVEYRFRLGELSYLFVFYDQAFLKSFTSTGDQYIQPYGVGGGITFSTKAGLFSVSYAAGTIPPAAISVKNAKVQFGYAGYF